MRGTRFTLIVASVTLAALAFPAHASSDAPDWIRFGGADCRDLRLLALTQASRLDGLVPSNFNVQQNGMGQAVVLVSVTECRDPHLNGHSQVGRMVTSDVGVFIDAPDGSDGLHYYQLTSGVDTERHWHELKSFGVGPIWTNYKYNTMGPAVTTTAGIASLYGMGLGSYSIGVVGAQFSAPNEFRYVGWTVFKGRTIATEQHLYATANGIGEGRLHVNEDEPLAKIVDGGSYPTFLSTLRFEANVGWRG